MKKLDLSVDQLQVESFETAEAPPLKGTVRGQELSVYNNISCYASCIETGCNTCDNSLDYCTCADCPVHTDFCPDTRGTTCRCQ
ncbi:MAG TPA: hypothetical protein VFJ16_05230 [Longimicrobium sp.]|nr:hypothetical protein [Longimicrobium sp.]